MRKTIKKTCYGVRKGKVIKLYRRKTKTNKVIWCSSKTGKSRYNGKKFMTKRNAMKKLNKRKHKSRRRTKRSKRSQRGGGQRLYTDYNLSCNNVNPALGHPMSTNQNNNIPPSYKHGGLMLDQTGGGLLQNGPATSDIQGAFFDIGTGLKNIAQTWKGGEMYDTADPLQQTVDYTSAPNRHIDNIATIRDNAKNNIIQQ
jgi:hypothetical protein